MTNTITQFIGNLMEVRPITTKTKQNGEWIEIPKTELTVMFEGITEDGYIMPRIETVVVDGEDFDLFIDKKNSFVSIPFLSIPKGDGFSFKFFQDMPILTFDKNPLDYSKFKREKTIKKS